MNVARTDNGLGTLLFNISGNETKDASQVNLIIVNCKFEETRINKGACCVNQKHQC